MAAFTVDPLHLYNLGCYAVLMDNDFLTLAGLTKLCCDSEVLQVVTATLKVFLEIHEERAEHSVRDISNLLIRRYCKDRSVSLA